MNGSLVLKQDQVEVLYIVSDTYRKHDATTVLHISTIFNCYIPVPIGGSFVGLVDIANKIALNNG